MIQQPSLRICGTTRDPTSPHAQTLLKDFATARSNSTLRLVPHHALQQALEGADALFLVTFSNFGQPQAEVDEAVAVAAAAGQTGLRLLVFSSGVRTHQPLFDAKADAEEAIRKLGAAGHQSRMQLVFVHTGFFYENLILKGGQPRLRCHRPHGSESLALTFQSPFPADFPVVMHAASDAGRYAGQVMFESLSGGSNSFGQEAQHQPIVQRIVGQKLTAAEYVDTVSRVATEARGWNWTADYEAVPLDLLRKAAPGAQGEALSTMFQWVLEGGMAEYDADTQLVKARCVLLDKGPGLRRGGWILPPCNFFFMDAHAFEFSFSVTWLRRSAWPHALDFEQWLRLEGLDLIAKTTAQAC